MPNANTYKVMVGGSSLVYTPPALSGIQDKDTIIFLFLEKNHTLTQSSFASPCMAEGGFKSGFMPSDGIHIPFIIVEFVDVMHTGSPLCKSPLLVRVFYLVLIHSFH
jgi:hypothetical protein